MYAWAVGRVPPATSIPGLDSQDAKPDPSKQTVGYSGRCSQGAGDYYTKYKDLATQICNRA